jgi:hypothetical protein
MHDVQIGDHLLYREFSVSSSFRLQIRFGNARWSAESFDGFLVRDIAVNTDVWAPSHPQAFAWAARPNRPNRRWFPKPRSSRGGVKDLSVSSIVRYIEAVERLDPTIVRDAIAELNRNEYALGRISGRYHWKERGRPLLSGQRNQKEEHSRVASKNDSGRLLCARSWPFVKRQSTATAERRMELIPLTRIRNVRRRRMTRRSSMIEIVWIASGQSLQWLTLRLRSPS